MKILKKSLVVITITILVAGMAGAVAQERVQSRNQSQHAIRDSNGDGICDTCGQPVGSSKANAQGQQAKEGKHWGPGDGTGNQGNGPKDGTGYGSQSGKGIGARDGTGPYHQNGGQGSGRRGGRS
jgi:hypothetical protein